MIDPIYRPFAAALCLSIAPLSSWACATCGCTVNSDAAMGFSATPGWRVNLEYTYIDQDELRIGTRSATPAEVVNQPSNRALGGGEIEKDTINRYLTVGISYRPTADWNINLLVPYVVRTHTTYGTQSQPYTPAETAPDQISGARVDSLGDVKLLGSYQGLTPDHNLGLQLGVKLPTGQYGTKADFYNGPNAGSPLDASLQAGTGSTDVIVGAYYYRAVSLNFDMFVNAQFQAAVAHKQNRPDADFRPGNSQTFGIGLRYAANPRWIPQVQINMQHKSPDQGALADTTDTVGTVAYISPGLTVQVSHKLHAYGLIQVPVYSNLDGYQLFPHYTATGGLSYAF
ncbi:MAG: transporter [Pseudomonadota bacterium]|nr:transporter [Pseudomonadota bacterium]